MDCCTGDGPHAAVFTGVDEMMNRFHVLGCALLLGACGGGSTAGMNPSAASAYDRAALQISDTVTSYGAASATMGSSADCNAAVQQYANQVQPMIDRMASMAGPMDDAMKSMGQMMGADLECGAAVMKQELQRHLGSACSSPDMIANRSEARRHADAMQQIANHMRMRAAEAGTMMGSSGSMMQGGGMASGTMDGGWKMPDGTVMSWDAPMPGCHFADGEYHADGSVSRPSGW